MTRFVTQQQRDNALEALYVMWPSIPVVNVAPALRYWRTDHGQYRSKSLKGADCGTVACFGGWCAIYPKFQEQGVTASSSGSPMVTLMGQERNAAATADFLFGDEKIFNMVGNLSQPDLSRAESHAVVTLRLKALIADSEVTES